MVYRLSSTPPTKLVPRSCTPCIHRRSLKLAWRPSGYRVPPEDTVSRPLLSSTSRTLLQSAVPKSWNPSSVSRWRGFHSTPRNQGGPLLPVFAALLKASTSLEFARTASRIALTFVPVILLKNYKTRSYLQWSEKNSVPGTEERRPKILRGIRNRTRLFHVLVLTPIILFWATLLASLEKTPLTGRWRLILLSPEEEDQISDQLAGPGWYQAVSDILAAQCEDGKLPTIVPQNDWRYIWVESTLRQLESGIPVLQDESSITPNWLEVGPGDIQLPPPAEYPLRPRPRASDYLRIFCDMTCGKVTHPSAHVATGPPYSLLIVDKPDASNAFSYGFGPNGGGGIVVFSGFIDEMVNNALSPTPSKPRPEATPEPTSWWSYLFGSLAPSPSKPSRITPTTEQTSQLAILLAHELSHLVLSHHLESLSSGSIIVPGVLSIATDLVRAVLFPFTMMFGPFVNDAVANMGKIGSGEASKLALLCSSRKQEIEADVVSTRLLAYAGFDPNSAIQFWENRQDMPETAECGTGMKKTPCTEEPEVQDKQSYRSVFQLFGNSHPVNKVRVGFLKEEMERWGIEKQVALSERQL